jgi:hypothetical protein
MALVRRRESREAAGTMQQNDERTRLVANTCVAPHWNRTLAARNKDLADSDFHGVCGFGKQKDERCKDMGAHDSYRSR